MLLVAAELLFVVWFVAIPMWVVGLVLLAVSGVWTGREKLLGLLALGTGLPVVLVTVATAGTTGYQSCSGSGTELATGATHPGAPPTVVQVWVSGVSTTVPSAPLASSVPLPVHDW